MARSQLPFFLVVSVIFQSTWGIVLRSPSKLGISGGDVIPIEAAPYMAALFLDYKLWCGAAIIDEQFVLTAAHCLYDMDTNATLDYKVLVGSNLLIENGIFIDIESIHCHDEFDSSTTENDICLLKLKETVPFGCIWSVDKVNLPADDRNVVGNIIATVSGWGSIGLSLDGGEVSNELRQAFVPVVGNACCRRIHPHVTDNMICAGSKDRNFCLGDTGSPLVYNDMIIGIASHEGQDCSSYPSVYTRVSSYLTWIQDTMNSNRW